MTQGLILLGWLIIQMLLIQTVHFFHYLLGAVGIAPILLGRLQKHAEKKNKLRRFLQIKN